MALKKVIINEKGIISEYHRISAILVNKDINTVEILIKSYTNEEYRDKEKSFFEKQIEIKERQNNLDEKNKLLSELVNKNVDHNNDKEIKLLTEEINIIAHEEIEETIYIETSLYETVEVLEYQADIEYILQNVYEYLKMTDRFIGAEDS